VIKVGLAVRYSNSFVIGVLIKSRLTMRDVENSGGLLGSMSTCIELLIILNNEVIKGGGFVVSRGSFVVGFLGLGIGARLDNLIELTERSNLSNIVIQSGGHGSGVKLLSLSSGELLSLLDEFVQRSGIGTIDIINLLLDGLEHKLLLDNRDDGFEVELLELGTSRLLAAFGKGSSRHGVGHIRQSEEESGGVHTVD
jgi:hypothetical protein